MPFIARLSWVQWEETNLLLADPWSFLFHFKKNQPTFSWYGLPPTTLSWDHSFPCPCKPGLTAGRAEILLKKAGTWRPGEEPWDDREQGRLAQKFNRKDAPSPKDEPVLPSLVGNRRQSRAAQPSLAPSLCRGQLPTREQLLSHRADTRQGQVKPYSLSSPSHWF